MKRLILLFLFVTITVIRPAFADPVQGKYLKIVYSANDAVCRKLFDIYEAGFLDRPDMRTGEFKYPEGLMPVSAATRHDDDPMFVRWKPFKNSFTDAEYEIIREWAEFDVDNDGTVERLMRTTLDHKYQSINEALAVFKELPRDQFINFIGTVKRLKESADFYIGKPIGYTGQPLRHHPDRDIKKPYYPLHTPRYDHKGYISPFVFKEQTYLSFFKSVLTQHTFGVWGVVQQPLPDGTADDVCYFDLNDELKKRVFKRSLRKQ